MPLDPLTARTICSRTSRTSSTVDRNGSIYTTALRYRQVLEAGLWRWAGSTCKPWRRWRRWPGGRLATVRAAVLLVLVLVLVAVLVLVYMGRGMGRGTGTGTGMVLWSLHQGQCQYAPVGV